MKGREPAPPFHCYQCGTDIPESPDWFNPWHDAIRVASHHICSEACLQAFLAEPSLAELRSAQNLRSVRKGR